MTRNHAFDETRSPFLLEVLEEHTPAARETETETETETERVPSAEGECECVGCRETAGSDEAFEAEDAYEMDEVDEVDESGTAFDRYQAAEGEEGESGEETDMPGESPFMGEGGDATLEAEDESGSGAYEAQDSSEAFEADGALETEDEAPDLAFDIQGEDEAPDLAYDIEEHEDESPFLEAMEAPQVEAQVPGQAQVVVSTGEFGNALAWFARATALPNVVPWLLTQSTIFTPILADLDAKYLHLTRPTGVPTDWPLLFLPDAEGVFTAGPHVPRRMLEIKPSNEGSFFRPVASPDGLLPADVLHLQAPPGTLPALDQNGRWLETIAHESIHAWRHVTGQRRTGKTAAERIRSAIDDEIETRREEGRIVAELQAMFTNFRRFQPTTGSLDPGHVERDFFPGALRRGYLESFVLEERLVDARRKLEGAFVPNKRSSTSGAEIAAYDAFVDRIPLEKRPLASYLVADPSFKRPDRDQLASFQLAYPRIRLIRRVIDARWRSVKDLDRRDLHRDPLLETMRQEHAKAFFGGLAAYTKLP